VLREVLATEEAAAAEGQAFPLRLLHQQHLQQEYNMVETSVLDPDSIGPVDPDLDSDYACGSGKPKLAYKQEKNQFFF
jgi:hypothetical protein